jgi:hypothetical protein
MTKKVEAARIRAISWAYLDELATPDLIDLKNRMELYKAILEIRREIINIPLDVM